ncbi:hypothetical protein [Phytohabitans suffuscus]|uniref:hypothetical protein n=1 Tax=Phytohabitans suffuscus TaxID=624315 RepID=UPI00156757A4|nr:hypothetical protein [Phytohabitans suffuscus]
MASGEILTCGLPRAEAVTELLVNPSFEQPGANAAAPTGWTPVLLENETSPFRWVVRTFNGAGQFPPPALVPDGQFALEMFWQDRGMDPPLWGSFIPRSVAGSRAFEGGGGGGAEFIWFVLFVRVIVGLSDPVRTDREAARGGARGIGSG